MLIVPRSPDEPNLEMIVATISTIITANINKIFTCTKEFHVISLVNADSYISGVGKRI